MPQISITKTYLNGNILSETDLDNIRNSISTFLNVTGIDSTNVQTGGLIGANLANGTVTASQIAANTITAAQLASSAVGQAQRAALPYAASSGISNSSPVVITGTSPLDVQGLGGVTITSIGRPIFLALVCNSTGAGNGAAQIANTSTLSSNYTQTTIFARNSTAVQTFTCSFISTANLIASSILPTAIDIPGAGTWTYKTQAYASIGSTATFYNCQMVAFEL